jgi:hypothetical protein
MNVSSKSLLKLSLIILLALGVLLASVPLAWAGPVSGTIPTASPAPTQSPTATTPPATPIPGLRWTVTTNALNCPASCLLQQVLPNMVAPAPRLVTFSSAAIISGYKRGFLRFTVRVCYQTTDRLDRIYYYETFIRPNRWVRLPVTLRSATQVCTNVRLGNVTFAAGH